MKGRKKTAARSPLEGNKSLKMKCVVEERTDPAHLSSLFITTSHSHVKHHFLLGSFQTKALVFCFFFLPPLSFPKAFLVSLARTSWAGPWPLSCHSEEERGKQRWGQVTFLVVGVGRALPTLASQRETEVPLPHAGFRVWLTAAVWSWCCRGVGKIGRNSIVVIPHSAHTHGGQREGEQSHDRWQQRVGNPSSTSTHICWSRAWSWLGSGRN